MKNWLTVELAFGFLLLHCLIAGSKASRHHRSSRCNPPKILINGATPFQNDSVDFSKVHEIHFTDVVGPEGERVCKIQCLNGKWIGPLCGDGINFQPEYKACKFNNTNADIVIFFREKQQPPRADLELPHGAELVLRCADVGKFSFEGSESIKCYKGEWIGLMPVCHELSESSDYSPLMSPTIIYQVPTGAAAQSNDGKLIVYPGSIIHLSCLWKRQLGNPRWSWTHSHRKYPLGWSLEAANRELEYRLSIYYANSKDSGIYSCTTPIGLHHFINLIVKEVNCPPINQEEPLLYNGIIRMNGVMKFSCTKGHYLIGPAEIHCLVTARWNTDTPTCEPVQCPLLRSPDVNLQIEMSNNTFGSNVKFSCSYGYSLKRGSTDASCDESGHWSFEVLPYCEAILCTRAIIPKNGRIIGRVEHSYIAGSIVNFACDKGYALIGSSMITCKEDRTWSHESPHCVLSCEYPGAPDHGKITPAKFYYKIDEAAEFSCNDGFRIRGAKILYCLPTGHWSQTTPDCVPRL